MNEATQCRGIRRADWRRGVAKNTRCQRRVADPSGFCMEHREQAVSASARPADVEIERQS